MRRQWFGVILLGGLCGEGMAQTYTGPITITAGGTYTGNWQSTSPGTPAVTINTTQPVTIVNSRFKGPSELLVRNSSLVGCDVTVTNCLFQAVNPNAVNNFTGRAINLSYEKRVVVESCDFIGGGGIYLPAGTAPYATPHAVTIRYNRFRNMDSRASDGVGGYLSTGHVLRGAISVGNHYGGVPNVEIAWNEVVDEPFNSRSEDSLSFYDLNASAASPGLIHDNYIQGGYNSIPTDLTISYTGNGINAEGSATTDPDHIVGYLNIYNNQVVSYGNGMAISGGHNNALYNNRVVSPGTLANGATFSTAGVGMGYWNLQNNTTPGVFGNNAVHDNLVGFRRNVSGTWIRIDYKFWTPLPTATNNVSWTPNDIAHPTLADEAAEFTLWQAKLAANGVVVGSSLTPSEVLSDQAAGGTASASAENAPSEGAAMAFDGASATKWFAPVSGSAAWLRYQFAGAAAWKVSQYQLTSANDTPARDPRDWQFQGSQDGTTWVTLDTQVGQVFPARFQTVTYNVSNDNEIAYKYYRLNVLSNAGATPVGVQLAQLALLVPGLAPWATADIGGPDLSGSATASHGQFSVTGSGSDIWGTADQFRYVYQTVSGNCDVRCRIVSQSSANIWAKAGIMIRATLDPGSPHAFLQLTPGNGFQFSRRLVADGASVQSGPGGTPPAPPYWLRLTRSGSAFSAFTSPDGAAWTAQGSVTITMGTSVLVGLAVTSHDDAAADTAVFDGFTGP